MECKNFINESTMVAPPSGGCKFASASSAVAVPLVLVDDPQPDGVLQVSTKNRSKTRRRRRGKRRRWKPYFKLTSDERKKLEIFEEKRAERARALRFKHGFPVAPYNTTQFLLNDRQRNDIDKSINVDEIVANIRTHTRSGSYESVGPTTSSGSSTGSTDDEDYCMFEQREFDEEYETANTERLESMTKTDLIKEYVEMEKEFDHVQREVIAKLREIVELKQKLAAKASDASLLSAPDDTGQRI